MRSGEKHLAPWLRDLPSKWHHAGAGAVPQLMQKEEERESAGAMFPIDELFLGTDPMPSPAVLKVLQQQVRPARAERGSGRRWVW